MKKGTDFKNLCHFLCVSVSVANPRRFETPSQPAAEEFVDTRRERVLA